MQKSQVDGPADRQDRPCRHWHRALRITQGCFGAGAGFCAIMVHNTIKTPQTTVAGAVAACDSDFGTVAGVGGGLLLFSALLWLGLIFADAKESKSATGTMEKLYFPMSVAAEAFTIAGTGMLFRGWILKELSACLDDTDSLPYATYGFNFIALYAGISLLASRPLPLYVRKPTENVPSVENYFFAEG